MNPRVPDEVQVQKVLQVKAGVLAASPELDMKPIEFSEDSILAAALAEVARYQISRAFGDFKSHLHAHGALREGANQSFEQSLQPIPTLVACVVRLNAAHLVSRDERAIQLHRDVVEQIPNPELLAQRRGAQRLPVFFGCKGHLYSPARR